MTTRHVYGDDQVWFTDEPTARGYKIRWTNPDGTTGNTLRKELEQAQEFAREKAQELRDHDGTAPDADHTTVAEAADLFLDGDSNGLNYAASTLNNKTNHFRKYVLPALGNVELDDLDATMINRCLSTYQGKPSGERQLLFSIRAFVNWATTMGYEVDSQACLDTAKLKKLPTSRRKVEPGDIPTEQAIVGLAERSATVPTRAARDGRDWRRLALLLAAYAGHRPGELMAVTPAKLEPGHGRILIDVQYSKHERKLTPPKYGSVRYTMLPPHLEDDLMAHAQEVANQYGADAPLFPLESNPVGFSTSDHFAKSYFSPAALATPEWDRDWTLHSLRHFFATYSINVLGRPVVDVSKWMGHSKPSVTMDMYVGQSADAFAAGREAMAAAQAN